MEGITVLIRAGAWQTRRCRISLFPLSYDVVKGEEEAAEEYKNWDFTVGIWSREEKDIGSHGDAIHLKLKVQVCFQSP